MKRRQKYFLYMIVGTIFTAAAFMKDANWVVFIGGFILGGSLVAYDREIKEEENINNDRYKTKDH